MEGTEVRVLLGGLPGHHREGGTETARRGGLASHSRDLDQHGSTLEEAAYQLYAASLVAQVVKNLPVVQETHVRSLGWEDLLEKGIYTYTSVFLTEESHGQRSLELGIFNS